MRTATEKGSLYMFRESHFTAPEEPRRWSGRWIWAPENVYGDFQESPYTLFQKKDWDFGVFYFEKKIVVEDIPDKAEIYISADSNYKLSVNGAFIGRGSAQPGGDYANCDPLPYKFYENYNIEDILNIGVNYITVRVCLGPVVQSEVSCGHGGLIADMVLIYPDGRSVIYGTDDTWTCIREEAWQERDIWDGRKAVIVSENACHTGERNGKEYQAEIVSDQEKFPKLLPAGIPNLEYAHKSIKDIIAPFESETSRLEYDPGEKVIRIKKGAPYTFWLDYGRIYAAWPRMKISGKRGTKLTLHMQEFPGKIERSGTTECYMLGDGLNNIESLRMHSVHYIQVTVSNLYEDIEIIDPIIDVSLYPANMKGSFQCSDPDLEKIYLLGCRTNQICRQTYHMDSPIHQEPLGCMGDYMIESLMNYYTFGDKWLTRFDILKIAYYMKYKNYRMFHPSYCLLYIQMIYDYVMYTGDIEILDHVEETVQKIIKLFEEYLGENMLIEHAPNYMFMDWVEEGEYNRHHPPKCMGQGYLTAMFAGALDTACRLISLINEFGERTKVYLDDHETLNLLSEHYRQKAGEVKAAVNRLLWDKEAQLYIDGLFDENAAGNGKWLPADVQIKFTSQHMNTLAVLYDIAPEDRQKDLMVRVMEDASLSQAQPYFMHFVFDALAKTGLFEKYGLEQLRRWNALLRENESGLKEVWYGFDCDYSHAWGGTPTYQMPAKILGVTPAEPGFKKVKFSPCLPRGLDWAYGKVPTPDGVITVSVKRENGEVKAEYTGPEEEL